MLTACGQPSVPKPAGYFRIDLPEKQYIRYEFPCSYSIEYPAYARINLRPSAATDTCWMDIEFPTLKAKVHLTYFNLHGDLASLTESSRELAYKHTVRADAIEEKLWADDLFAVYTEFCTILRGTLLLRYSSMPLTARSTTCAGRFTSWPNPMKTLSYRSSPS